MVRNIFLFILAYTLVVTLTPIVFVLNILRKLYRKDNIKEYIETCAIGQDQAGGSILYEQENFTISSYTYHLCYHRNNKQACWFLKFIDLLFGKGHCKRAFDWETKHDMNELNDIV